MRLKNSASIRKKGNLNIRADRQNMSRHRKTDEEKKVHKAANNRAYYEKNKVSLKKKHIEYSRSHRNSLKPFIKKQEAWRRQDKKRLSDPKMRLHLNISRRIRWSLRKVGKRGLSWEKLVGYSTEKLKNHLEKHFLPGMTWENYGQWHIDHRIPVSAFNFIAPDDIDFKKCWELKNLRPLWAKDNLIKNNKIEKPFQPALTIKG